MIHAQGGGVGIVNKVQSGGGGGGGGGVVVHKIRLVFSYPVLSVDNRLYYDFSTSLTNIGETIDFNQLIIDYNLSF